MTAAEQRKKKARQMADYYAARGDSTSAGAKAAQRAVSKAEGKTPYSASGAAVQKYRANKPTTVQDIYANRPTRQNNQTQAPNPALAQSIVNQVSAQNPGIRISSGAARNASTRQQMEAAQTKELGNVERIGTLERIGKSARSGLKDWAAGYMDYAAAGTAAENRAGTDLTRSALAGYKKQLENERAVMASYERGEGLYDKKDYAVAREQAENLQRYINAYDKALGANEEISGQTAAESEKLKQSAAMDSEEATSGLGKVGTRLIRGVGTTVQNLLDSAVGGFGPRASFPSMAARVYGQATENALNDGISREGAVRYGLAQAAAELAPELFFSGNPLTDAADGGLVSEAADSLLSNPRAKKLRDALGAIGESKYVNNFLTKLGADAFGEGVEEVVTQGLNDIIDRITYGDEKDLSTPQDYAEAFWGGVIGSLYGNALRPSGVINNAREDIAGLRQQTSQNGVDEAVDRLAQSTGDNPEALRNVIAPVWQNEQRLINNLATYYAGERGLTPADAASVAQSFATRFYSDLAAEQQAARHPTQSSGQQMAQEAAQQAPQPTEAGIAPNAENAPSGVFNTAQDAQEAKPTQTVADIYANRATRQPDGSIQVGRATTIKKPYTGTVPVQTQYAETVIPVSDESLSTAQNRIEQAKNDTTKKSFRAALSAIYKQAFQPTKNIPVDGMTYEAQPYTVDVNRGVYRKLVSDRNFSSEKLAVLDSLPEIIQNAQYVGSGEYGKAGKNADSAIRYDYFETTVSIGGKNYAVLFDVEVLPSANNYRTHRIVEIEITPIEGEIAGGKNVTPQRPSDQLVNTGLSSEAYADTHVSNDTITSAEESVNPDGRDIGKSRAEVEREYQALRDEFEISARRGIVWMPTDSRLQRMLEIGDWLTEHPEADARYVPETAPDGRDMDEGSLFDATKGPGAGATREGPQVPSQNNLTRDMSLSEEARQHIADSTPTHEQISDKLANARADAQIIRGPDGSWVNLQDSMDDLRQTVTEHGVLTPEQVKLAHKVESELERRARESNDWEEARAFNRDVISRTKTNSAQSLHAWREFSGSGADVTTTALDILDNAPLRKGVDVNEVASRVSSYSDRAQQLFDANDISGLQALVTEISTERGYKPSRSIQKIINEQANVEQLYAMAQQLSVALAVDQIKPGIGQQLSTWQTLSHLLNSRTIIRNVVSNALFSPVDRIANNVGMIPDFIFSMVRSAASDKSIAQSRTVGYQPNLFAPTPGGKQVRQTRKEYIQQARLKNALDVNLDGERSKNPNKPDRAVNRTFKRKGTSGEGWVNKAWNRYNNIREGVLGYGLNVTDAWQKGKTKGQSEVAMGRLMNRDGSVVSGAASERITNDDMLYRSFQRDTALGDALAGIREFANRAGVGRRVGKGGKSHEYGLGSMLGAYTQVPGALVHTEADYTPLGVLNTAGELYNAIRYGKAQADGVVEGGKYDGMTNADASVVAQHNAAVSLGRAGIGGGVIFLFGWLARAGIVAFQPYGGDDKDKDETNAAQGKGGLQFNQSAFVRALQGKDTTWQDGDIIHDLSQYPPLSTIAEIGVILADEEDDNKFINLVNATARGIAEQFGDLSMMNTVRTIYDDIQYKGDKNAGEVLGDIAGDLAADSVSGLIPGTIRQIAKVSDGTMRDTNADTVQERVWNRFRSVMPGLRQTLPAKVDYKGEERQYAGNALTRGLNTFLLPGDVTIYQQDEVVDYIDKVAEETGKSLYAAAYAPKSFTVTDADGNEQTITLDTDARRAYNEEYKGWYYAALDGLKSSDYADKLSYEQVAEIGRELRSLAADSAKRLYCEQNGIEYSSSYDKYQSIENPALYLAMKESLKQLRKTDGVDNAAFTAVYNDWRHLSTEEKKKYTEGVEGEFDGIDTLKKLNSCINGGLSTEQFYKAKNAHDEIDDLGLKASEERARFANWLDRESGFTTAEKHTALSNFLFTTTLVADEGNYEKMTEAGVSKDGSLDLFNTMQKLEPADGYDDVAGWQKYEAITSSGLPDDEQLAALSVYATDSAYDYYQAAYNYGVAPSKWSNVLANIRSYEGTLKSDGKSTYSANVSQESLCRAMFDAGLSDAQAEAMYNEYRSARNWTKTYYQARRNVNWSRLGYKTR